MTTTKQQQQQQEHQQKYLVFDFRLQISMDVAATSTFMHFVFLRFVLYSKSDMAVTQPVNRM